MDPISQMMMAGSASSFGGGGVEFVGQTTYSRLQTTSGTETVTLSGLQADDVVFLAFNSANLEGTTGSGSIESRTPAELTSWTRIIDDSLADEGGFVPEASRPSRGLWYKVATGSSVSIDFAYQPANAAYEYTVRMFAYRGLNTTTPTANGRLYSSKGLFVTSLDASARTCPAYDTVSIAFYLHGYGGATMLPPSGYVDLGTLQSSTNAANCSVALVTTLDTTNSQALSSRTFNSIGSSANEQILYEFWLVPEGENGTPPVISGSSSVNITAGGTSVATYTANESVTWSLIGPDASLFSISSGGVLTFNTASTEGIYDVTVVALNADNIEDLFRVEVKAATSGTFGGGITLVDSATASTSTSADTTVSVTGLSSGDVVVLNLVSDEGNTLDAEAQASLASNGWTQDTSAGWSGSSPTMLIYTKVTTGTSESLTFTSGASSEDRFAVVMSAWRGVDNTDPIRQNSSTINAAFPSSLTVPSWFTIGPGVVVLFSGLDDRNTTVTSSAGYTEIGVVGWGFSTTAAAQALYYKNTTGAVTESAATVTFGSSPTYAAAWSFLLRAN